MIVKVNIYNTGTWMGIKTPCYNYPMDAGLFTLLREMGFQIELSSEADRRAKAAKKINARPEGNAEKVRVEDSVVVAEIPAEETEEKPAKIDSEDVSVFDESWADKPSYTDVELAAMNKKQLKTILHHRGHYSTKPGPGKDPLAPLRDDPRAILLDKIAKSNKIA
jgi:hypothetical protein